MFIPLIMGPGVYNPTLQAQWPWTIWDLHTGVRIMEAVVTVKNLVPECKTFIPRELDPPAPYHSASGNGDAMVYCQIAPRATPLL